MPVSSPSPITHITSKRNKRIQRVRSVRDGRVDSLIFLEGSKLAGESLAAGLEADGVIVSDSFLKEESNQDFVLTNFGSAPEGILAVPAWLMKDLSSVQTPPGIIVLANKPSGLDRRLPDGCDFVVILNQLQDPGNLGSILRSAEAAGAGAAVVTANSADPLRPKALRGSMGASLRLPVWNGAGLAEAMDECHRIGMQVFATSPRNAQSYWDVDWKQPCAVLLGGEGGGLSEEEIAACDGRVQIPMAGECESLNVSAAAALIFFEIARQRMCEPNEQPVSSIQ
tara:strand:+ start:125 stop:973 length:849 start_codon:yes stop_codon:yes gene_type:complete